MLRGHERHRPLRWWLAVLPPQSRLVPDWPGVRFSDQSEASGNDVVGPVDPRSLGLLPHRVSVLASHRDRDARNERSRAAGGGEAATQFCFVSFVLSTRPSW